MGDVAGALREASDDVLGSLTPEQRELVRQPFEVAGERQRWYYTPTNHGGLLLSNMTPDQHQAVCRLIAAGLSEGGYNTAMAVMTLESILDHFEHWPGRPNFRPRDPLRYSLTVFGDPSEQTWGWRLGGHHLSLNFTISGGDVTATPCFMGADPSTAPMLGDDEYAPLQGAETTARGIMRALSADQRRTAVVSPHAPWDLVLANRSQPEVGAKPRKLYEIFRDDPETMRGFVEAQQREIEAQLGVDARDLEALSYSERPQGIAVESLPSDLRDDVGRLVAHYIGRLTDDLAKAMLSESPVTSLHFAWAGSMEPGESHYYRIQGPTLLLEYVNVRRTRGHIHAVLRDPRGDFGVRMLS